MRDPFSYVRHDPSEMGICSIAAALIGTAASAATAGVTVAGAGALLGGVSSIVGSQSAAGAETKAANQANATLQQQQAQTRADLLPYNQNGQQDSNAYNALIGQGGNPAEQQAILQSLPGYQFTQTQGLKSVQNSAAARGLGVSGAALKGAANYSNGLAQSNYGTYANQLLSGAQLGENAAAQTGSINTGNVQSQASNTTSAGVAQGNADVASGNAVANGLGNLYLYNALSGGASSGGLFGNSNAANSNYTGGALNNYGPSSGYTGANMNGLF